MSEQSPTVANENPAWIDAAINGLSYFLAFVFFAAGLFKVFAWNATAEQFERFGYDSWFIPVVVIVELAAAGFVFFPKTRSWGTSLISITMFAAMFSHLKAGEPGEMIAPFVILVLSWIVAWWGPLKPGEVEQKEGQTSTEPMGPVDLAKHYAGFVLCATGVYSLLLALFGKGFWEWNRLVKQAMFLIAFGIFAYGMMLFSAKPSSAKEKSKDKQPAGRRR